MEQMVSPVILVREVGKLPTKVSNYHTQPENDILSNKYINKTLHL